MSKGTQISPHERTLRASKLRRQGSRIMSVFRNLGNSISNSSADEPIMISGSRDPFEKDHLSTLALPKGQCDLTIIRHSGFKSRPSVIFNKEMTTSLPKLPSPNTIRDNSHEKSLSICSCTANSTSLTRSIPFLYLPTQGKPAVSEPCAEGYSLETILEGVKLGSQVPEPVPTLVTVEKAASAKIFFECHYNNLTSTQSSPRSIRRRQLERLLYQNQNITALDKEVRRQSLAKDECEHLRLTRILKSQARKAMTGQNMIITNYEVIKILGKGSFGVVRLVREKTETIGKIDFHVEQSEEKKRQVYAMKVIRKSKMIHNSQEGHLRAERDFLVAAERSRWVVPLIASFQDISNLYLVMEYMPGGDFLGLLIRENVLPESVTRWYIAEMILCIEEAHNLRWIHRDIKPDNFLISSSGHLKISDFGLAFDGHWSHDQSYFNNHRYTLLEKLGLHAEGDSIDKKEDKSLAIAIKTTQIMLDEKKRHRVDTLRGTKNSSLLNWRNKHSNRSFARSIVGTTQYMAPEVIRGEIYDGRCDWWSLAIILFECLYGHTPFLAEEGGRQQTKLNILEPAVSRKCQDLIRSIIQEKDKRLCSRRYRNQEKLNIHRQSKDYQGRFVYPKDAEEIKSHKWFRDIQWDSLHTMVPPIVPDIKSLDDTRYFDEENSLSDFSESSDEVPFTPQDISNVLKPLSREIQLMLKGYFERPYDSDRLRMVENEVNNLPMPKEEKKYLLAVIKLYGKKDKKRARDRLLRDELTAPKVMELRKQGAFLGYTYRRFKPSSGIGRNSLKQNALFFGSNYDTKVWNNSKIIIN
ncbi:Serine/threonine-protein kinase [Podosphaera aphanis]|nr:Serine/threonine-protein kinase [Podosphaera aphanis]